MVGFLWNLFKLFRYLLPFLYEISDERLADDTEDKEKARKIRSLLRRFLYRLIFFIIFIITVFYFAIPLYTQNKILQQEVRDLEDQLTQKNLETREIQGLLRRSNDTITIKTIELTSAIEEQKRQANILAECRVSETTLRSELLNHDSKDKTSSKVKLKSQPVSSLSKTRIQNIQ